MSGLSARSAAVVAIMLLGIAGLWFSFSPVQHQAARCGTGTEMQRIELAFGMARKGRPDVSDAEWQTFLAREITPRFPDGLTVLSAQGQWRNASGVTVREPARLLLVWAKPSADLETRIAAIRGAWKAAHAQESVLLAQGTSCVSF